MKKSLVTIATAALLYATPAMAANSFWGGFAQGLAGQQQQRMQQQQQQQQYEQQQQWYEQFRRDLRQQQWQSELQEQLRQLQRDRGN